MGMGSIPRPQWNMREEGPSSLSLQPPPPVSSLSFPRCLLTQFLHPIMCSELLSLACSLSLPSSTLCPTLHVQKTKSKTRSSPGGLCFPVFHGLPMISHTLLFTPGHHCPLETLTLLSLTQNPKGGIFCIATIIFYPPRSVTIPPGPGAPMKVLRATASSQTYLCPQHPPYSHPSALASFSD